MTSQIEKLTAFERPKLYMNGSLTFFAISNRSLKVPFSVTLRILSLPVNFLTTGTKTLVDTQRIMWIVKLLEWIWN